MPAIPQPGFLDELKRRSVIRVGAAYLVAAWLLIQIADTVFPYIGITEVWVTRLIGLLAVGFVPALVAAWIFEWTPAGIRRDGTDATSGNKPVVVRKKMDYVIVAMLTVALALFAYDRFVAPIGRIPVTVIANANPAVAVLPFENRSALDEDVFFVDGVHDDILTSLAKIGSLKVISQTSVAQYRGTTKSMPEIGMELGVTSVLEGGIQRAGNRIRVNVQLIDVATDTHQWAEIYDRELTTSNIFAIQSEISSTIARALQATLLPEERDRIDSVPTNNLEAYEAYLLGNEQLRRRRGVTIERGVGYFKEAIELDPNFAQAYRGLADSYILLFSYTNRQWDELKPLALAAAQKAVSVNPELGEGYASLAQIHNESREFDLARPLFVRALELSPNYATGHQWYSEYLNRIDEIDAAIEHIETALRLDPLSPIINHIYARRLSDAGRFDEAAARWRKAIEIDAEFARAYQGLAVMYFQKIGRLDEAAKYARHAALLNPDVAANHALLANIFLNMGDFAQARRWLDEAIRVDSEAPSTLLASSNYFLLQRDFDAAAEIADRMLARYPRGRWFLFVKVDYFLNAGRPDEALALCERAFPELTVTENPEIDAATVNLAITMAHLYRQVGQPERATALLNRVSQFLDSYPGEPSDLGTLLEVRLLSQMGKNKEAISALRTEVDAGWRYLALYLLDVTPTLDGIRNEPEFVELSNEVKADLARQRSALGVAWEAEFGETL